MPLERVVPRGDTVVIAGRMVAGFGRVLALNTEGPYYAGALAESALGAPPASDVNGDGDASRHARRWWSSRRPTAGSC